MGANRSIIENTANQIDLDLFRLAARIDELAEMAARGKPAMDRALIDAASNVASARTAVRRYMCTHDALETA